MTIRKLTFEGDSGAAFSALEEARRFSDKVEDVRAKMGANKYTRTMDLPDGSIVYVDAFIGANDEPNIRTHIFAPFGVSRAIEDYKPEIPVGSSVGVADYVCGYVHSPSSEEVTLYEGEDYERVALINTNVVQTQTGENRIPDPALVHEKMGVPVSTSLAISADYPLNAIYSQHNRVRSGNYSGRMQELVQLLLGMGDIVQDTYERRELATPEHTQGLSAISASYFSEEEETDSTPLVSAFGLYKDVTAAPVRTQVHYDYRPFRSHGLTWGPSTEDKPRGRCYLIQVGTQGVHAMPLPLDDVTATTRGREQLQKLYPEMFGTDGVYDWFGGMPTGERFPIFIHTDRYVRAGEIVELVSEDEMKQFLETSWYSSSYGWSFDRSGTRASITSFDYETGGRHAFKRGWLFTVKFDITTEYEEQIVNPRAGEVIATLKLTEEWERNKASRLTDDQTDTILADPEGVDFDEDFEVPAPFSGTGSFFEEMHGYLFWPGRCRPPADCFAMTSHPQFKFADELFDWQTTVCMNVEHSVPEEDLPVCETPIWVGYRGDAQVLVYYWWAHQPAGLPRGVSSREECQYEGSWTEESLSGNEQVNGHFYSTDFDLRGMRPFGAYKRVAVEGRFAGLHDQQQFTQYFGNCTNMKRHVHVEYTREGYQVTADRRQIACTTPFFARNLFCMVEYDTRIGVRTWTSIGEGVVGTTGFVRHGYVYDFVFHWSGGCPHDKDHIGGWHPFTLSELLPMTEPSDGYCGSLSKYGPPTWFEYDPRSGEILYESIYYDTSAPHPGFYEYSEEENEFKWKVHLGGDRPAEVPEVIREEEVRGEHYTIYDTTMSLWWFITSPTDCGGGCWQGSSQNHWGDLQLNIEAQPAGSGTEQYGAEAMQTHVRASYVGYVSNE